MAAREPENTDHDNGIRCRSGPEGPKIRRSKLLLAFILFALLYLIAMGAFFAAFVAVEFEAVGSGGAAATKCMLLVCVSNVSSDLMAPLDGQLHDRFGITAMLMTEAAIGVGSIALFTAVLHLVRLPGRGRENRLISTSASAGR